MSVHTVFIEIEAPSRIEAHLFLEGNNILKINISKNCILKQTIA